MFIFVGSRILYLVPGILYQEFVHIPISNVIEMSDTENSETKKLRHSIRPTNDSIDNDFADA